MGSGKVRRAAKCSGARAGTDRFGFQPQRLIQTAQRVGAEAAGEGGAGQAQDVVDPGAGRAGPAPPPSRAAGAARPAAAGPAPAASGPGAAITPCGRAGPGGAGGGPPRSQPRRLAARDRVARASCAMASPLRAGATPCPAKRASAQAAPGVSATPARIVRPRAAQSASTSRQQRGFAAEQMRAAGQVDHQAGGGLFGHPGGELAGPAAQRGQEGRLGQRIGGAGDQGGAHRGGIAQRLAQASGPRPRPRGSARRAPVRRPGRPPPRRAAAAHHPARRSSRSAARRGNQSERIRRCAILFLFCSRYRGAEGGVESASRMTFA